MMQNNSKNHIELTFENYPENEKICRTLAAIFTYTLDPTVEEISDLKTAVSEAVTNAIIHAYPGGSGKLRMTLDRKEREIWVIVQDYGIGMEDISLCMEPLYTTARSEERSGMGFTFMEAFTDELLVESRPGMGTKVSMKKRFG